LEAAHHINADLKPAWGETRNVHWNERHRARARLVMLPKDYESSQKISLVVSGTEGRPRRAPRSGASTAWRRLGDGLLRAVPNPRGSYGQGEASRRAT